MPRQSPSAAGEPPATVSTATLIQRLRDGDDLAREHLVERCLPLLKRWAQGRLPHSARDVSDTDDLVQVTLMRALGRVESFESRGQGAFLAYLRQILVNMSRDEIRKAARRPIATEVDEELPDSVRSPYEQSVDAETRAAYERALEALEEHQRNAVILRLEFGMSYSEIAIELERPSANAARVMVSRALTRMAQAMG